MKKERKKEIRERKEGRKEERKKGLIGIDVGRQTYSKKRVNKTALTCSFIFQFVVEL